MSPISKDYYVKLNQIFDHIESKFKLYNWEHAKLKSSNYIKFYDAVAPVGLCGALDYLFYAIRNHVRAETTDLKPDLNLTNSIQIIADEILESIITNYQLSINGFIIDPEDRRRAFEEFRQTFARVLKEGQASPKEIFEASYAMFYKVPPSAQPTRSKNTSQT